mgnify:FL=1
MQYYNSHAVGKLMPEKCTSSVKIERDIFFFFAFFDVSVLFTKKNHCFAHKSYGGLGLIAIAMA